MNYPLIDPIIVALGPVAIRWYGLMYLLAFATCYYLGTKRAPKSNWTAAEVSDVVFYGVAGTIVGGRVGFVLFYGFDKFLDDPLWLFQIWTGGMSFHGGLLGVAVALWLFGRKSGKGFFGVSDFVVPLVPLGLGFGRLGNFINAELPGRITDAAIGMHFPCESVRGLNLLCFSDFEAELRHVSSLYQAFTEGVIVFAIVWLVSAKPRRQGVVSGTFLVAYGTLRFCTEWFRHPDAGIGFIAFDWLTMGQLLSLPMALFGILLLHPVSFGKLQGILQK